jgi:predicted secreted protein
MTAPKQTICQSCDGAVFWARTEAGKAMLVDAESRSDGNLELLDDDPPRVRVVRPDQPTMTGHRYVSHFGTCPNADSHRRRRKRTPPSNVVATGPPLL